MYRQAVPIPVLVESGVRLSWPQAVALVQGIVASAAGGVQRPRGRDSLAGLALEQDGVVVITAETDPGLSVSELALLLGRLLPGELAAARDRPPAGLQFAVSRALGLAPAPPVAGVADFSRLLARFETGDRGQLLRDVFERYLVHTARSQASGADELQGHAASEPGSRLHACAAEERAPRRVERRRSHITPDVARRLLRDVDEQHYYARAAIARAGGEDAPPPESGRERTGVPVDILRRFLRDADRTAFEAARSTPAPRRPGRRAASAEIARRTIARLAPWRSCVPGVALAIALGLAAMTGEWRRHAAPAAPPAAPAPAQPLPDRSGIDAGAAALPATLASPAPAASASATRISPSARHGRPATTKKTGIAARRPMARADEAPAAAGVTPGAAATAAPPRHSAPVRFFGAIGHGLFRILAGPPGAQRRDIATARSAR